MRCEVCGAGQKKGMGYEAQGSGLRVKSRRDDSMVA